VKVQNISPFEPPTLLADLGIEPSTFSLDYVDTKVGTGQLAGAHSWYTINYTGYLTDGTKFDSSYDKGEPITIPYGQHRVIEGWDTGFAGMHVGGKRRLIIPFQLGYGANGKAPIPPKAMLIFDVELVDVSETEPKPKTPPAPPVVKSAPPQNQPGTQPAPVAPPPGSPTRPTPAPANPANPATVPPPADPTKPAAVPPPTTPKP
jgi:peptidylprolyl isomerase